MSRFAAAVILLLLSACAKPEKTKVEEAYAIHCGSCHLLPKIEDLPKSYWTNQVLPEMATRLGISSPDYDPYANMNYEERLAVLKSGIFPNSPLIDPSLYESISEYIASQAPDTLPPTLASPPKLLKHYRPHIIPYHAARSPSFSYLKIRDQAIEVGDLQGNLSVYNFHQNQWHIPYNFESPVVDFASNDSTSYALLVGLLDPSEIAMGKLIEIGSSGQTVLRDSLHRPVNLNITIMPEGKQFFIAEFGHLTGQLSRLSSRGEEVNYTSLVATPGAIRTHDVDINGDMIAEKIVLFAQGDERLLAIKTLSDGSIEQETLLRFSPLSGVSWFEAADVDGDGDTDLITAHGDNADNTYVHKPYHGIRIHANDGSGQFKKVYDYPMNGATRVVALDWDKDGDQDLAAVAAFPDYEMEQPRSFVLLENYGSETERWIPRTFPEVNIGRWFLMDAADLDDDGDQDIVLGVFNYHITPVPQNILERWNNEEMAFLILENTYLEQ